MTANIEFMRALEEEYRQASGLKSRSEYKIFYGQVFPAPILTLGLNPGGTPDETSTDGTRGKDGSPASSSASFFENMENDVLDCGWQENIGLRKLLLPLVGEDLDRFRREIVKTNIAFRRSRGVRNIDLAAFEKEAAPFVERIMARANPRLIVLTGVGIDRFLTRFARDTRPLLEAIRDPRINHVVFAATAARLKFAEHETIVAQVAHASQFAWTYERYGVSEMIASLMNGRAIEARDIVTGTRSITAPARIATPPNSVRQDDRKPRVAGAVHVSNPRLSELATQWGVLGIADRFHEVHHFASPQFSGKRERLESFIQWCAARDIRDENAQTLERALYVARRVEVGLEFTAALKEAWVAFPIVTR